MKQIKIILTAIVLFALGQKPFAQIVPEWATNYTSNYPVTIGENDMVTDKNGNIYITGYTYDTTYNYNILTIKYNSSGQLQWIHNHDSVLYYSKIAVDDFGNSFISGHSGNSLITLKYNTQGVLQWTKSYLSSGPATWAYDIAVDDQSSVYITGLANGNRLTTLKYNSTGVLQWAVSDSVVNGSTNSYITLDNKRNVYITGRADTTNCVSACKTIKYNTSGIKQWSRFYTSNFSPGMSSPRDLKFDPNGFIYLLAATTNNNDGQGDIIVVKYDTLGNHLWTLPTDFTTYYDVPKSMAIDKTGNVYVTGNIWPTGGTVDSIVTFKINKSGIFKWVKKYSLGYWNNDEAAGIGIDSLGYIYVAGKSSDNFNLENYVTIKYDSLGNQKWLARYKHTFSSSDTPNSISLDNAGNVYLSGGSSEMNSTGILTIKYSNAVGINEINGNSELLLNVFPNPFQSSLAISSEKNLKDAEFLLYDEFGKEVLKISNINRKDILIQRNNLADGIYFFRLLENNEVIAKGKVIAH